MTGRQRETTATKSKLMDPITAIAGATAVIKLAEDLYNYVAGVRATMQQTGEWTDAQEKAFQDLQAQRAASPWQKPTDPVLVTPPPPQAPA